MKHNNIIATALGVALFATPIATHAQVTIFADTFEAGNLDQWVGRSGPQSHSGVIVTDPLNPANNVLTFTAQAIGGDMFGAVPGSVNPAIQHLTISFDFLARPAITPPSDNGGFVGINPDTTYPSPYWLAGTVAVWLIPANGILLDVDEQWHHYDFDFTAVAAANNLTSFFVVLEDFLASANSVAGDAYFDNVQVTARLDSSVIAALVPCAGPTTGGSWKNHGAYVSAMAKATGTLVTQGLITTAEQDAYVAAAAQSDCGAK